MPLFHPRLTTRWCCAYAAAYLMVVTTPALCADLSPASAPLSPLDGAKQALNHVRQAKGLAELNEDLTKESAAMAGFTLLLVDSPANEDTTTLTPEEATRRKASEKVYQSKVEALMSRYPPDAKSPVAPSDAGAAFPGLTAHGHQFLTDALTLTAAYEKSRSSGKSSQTLSALFGQGDFPAESECDFFVLSPTHVNIVPRHGSKSPLEARLEDGQWRINLVAGPTASLTTPKLKTVMPQADAFLSAVQDGSVAAVEHMLKAHPALVNSPEAYCHGDSGPLTHMPLSQTALDDHPAIAALLIRYGANVNAEDVSGDTALGQAASVGSKGVAALLLAHGADVNHKNAQGETALHKAVFSDTATVVLLLAHGADVNARDQDGKTPLALALDLPPGSTSHLASVIKLLRQHGAKK